MPTTQHRQAEVKKRFVSAVDPRWDEAFARHALAARAYVATARTVADAAWTVPLANGKWSPAEVTEHLNRVYDVVLAQLRGGTGLRIRTGALLRFGLRALVLPQIFRRRKLPPLARAPFEVRPREVKDTQEEALARFERLGAEFVREADERRTQSGLVLTHHLFGEIDLLPGIDFVSIHVEHHHRQIAARAS